jgi:hypothetical protein
VAIRWPDHYTGHQDREAIERDVYYGKHPA